MLFAVDCFREKYKFCGDYLIEKNYSLPIVLGVPKSDKCFKCFDNECNSVKRYDNLKRARDAVAEIVYCNLTPHTKFMTLTTSVPILEVKGYMRKLTTFFQSMRRNGYDLRYVYVLERQLKRGAREGNIGAIHAHLIVFNDEKIELNILKKCWSHGRVEIKILNGLRFKDNKKTAELIRNPASYVCKYITKESVSEWNEKVYRCSKGLKRPIIINGKGALTPDSFIRSKECELIRTHITESYSQVWSASKKVQYSSDGKVITNYVDTTISIRKEP